MKKIFVVIFLISFFNISYGAIYNQDNRVSVNKILKIVNDFEKNANSAEKIKLRKDMLQQISIYGAHSNPDFDDYILGFVFHMIKTNIGEQKFQEGLTKVKALKEEPSLTYMQVLKCFSGINAESFYEAYFIKSPLIKFNISNAEYISERGKYYISFTLLRTTGDEVVNVPYLLEYNNKKEYGRLQSGINREETFKVPVELGAVSLYLDPNYHLMRELGNNEITPVIDNMLAKDDILLITNDENNNIGSYFKIKEVINGKSDITFGKLENENIIINGYNNKIAEFFVDKTPMGSEYSEYFIIKNPQNKEKYILFINNPTDNNLKVLKKYGINQELIFKGSSIVQENKGQTDMGIKIAEHKSNAVIRSKNIDSLDNILNEASLYKTIFVGEKHDEYSHHANQLEVIDYIYKNKKNVAIAMEMVQVEYLDVINDYVKGRISEKEMIDGIDYYNNWSFDYSLYAPIFKYAKENNIDIIPLNIPRSVTSKIFYGSIDNLTMQEKEFLPKKMNIINNEYENKIREIFEMHATSSKDFNNFYLSQNVWDEVMAKNIYNYRMVNPDTAIIVICGNGHAGKTSGIPYRYERISGEKSYVIMQGEDVNISNADAFIFPEYIQSYGTPTIGVGIEVEDGNVKVVSVAKDSPALKADIKKGDIIVKCGYHDITKIGDLKYALYEKGFDSVIECDIKRGKKILKKSMKLVPFEDSNMDEMIKAHIERVKNKGK